MPSSCRARPSAASAPAASPLKSAAVSRPAATVRSSRKGASSAAPTGGTGSDSVLGPVPELSTVRAWGSCSVRAGPAVTVCAAVRYWIPTEPVDTTGAEPAAGVDTSVNARLEACVARTCSAPEPR